MSGSAGAPDRDGSVQAPSDAVGLRLPQVTRRRALQIGAAAAGLVAAIEQSAVADADSRAGAAPARREKSFDGGWRFHRGDVSGADAVSFDDGAWRALDLPHDWGIEDLPYAASDDGGASSDPS